MAEASYGVRSNTLKPPQTVRGRLTSKHENERAFRMGSFRELLANISNVALKLLQVLKRSVEQSLSTKYVETMTRYDRSTLRNFTRNFDAGGSKLIFLIFDNQHNGTEDNNDNKRAVTYRSEDASNFFNFMTVMIIISYILYNVSSGLSVLSISLCKLHWLMCNHVRSHVVYDCVTNSRNLNVLGKCDVLGEAMQPFVHHQHDGVVKIKY